VAERFKAVCPRDCYDTCFLSVSVDKKGKITSVKGDSDHPLTMGLTCPRAAKDGHRVYKNRVLHPHIRESLESDQPMAKTSWTHALNRVAENLREVISSHGGESVLLLDYLGSTGLLTWYYPRRLWNAIGATRTDYGICAKSGHDALSLHYGLDYGIVPEDLLSQKLIVYWGFNGAVSSPHTWNLSLKARRENGALIVAVDPRRTKTAENADIWLNPRPGTDVALAYGIAKYIIEENYIDSAFIQRWTTGFDQFKKEALNWDLGRVEEVTGVKGAAIEKLGQAYGTFKPSATMIGVGFQKSLQGAESVRSVALLTTLLGLHRGFFYSSDYGRLVNMSYLTGEQFTSLSPKVVNQVTVGELVKRGAFKFIYIYNMNPALTLPGQKALREGLQRDDVFVVVHDTHWTETADFADVVLPAATYLEKDDLAIAWSHNHVMISRRVIEPQGESRDEVWVMQEVARRMSLQEEWLYESPWKAIEEALDGALMTGTCEDLLEGKSLLLRYRPRTEYQTPSGRVELYSTVAEAQGFSPIPVQILMEVCKGEFILLNSATTKYSHTQFQEVYGAIPTIVHVNSNDAEQHEIKDGNVLRLYNEQGELHLNAIVTDSVPKGVLWCPSLGVDLRGEPQNAITSNVPQSLGDGSTYNSTHVRIERKQNHSSSDWR